MSVLIEILLLCFNFDHHSLTAAMTSLWSLSILVPEQVTVFDVEFVMLSY